MLFASASYFLANKSLKNEPAPSSERGAFIHSILGEGKKERKNIFIFISCAALIVKSRAAAAKLMYYERNTYIGHRRRRRAFNTTKPSVRL